MKIHLTKTLFTHTKNAQLMKITPQKIPLESSGYGVAEITPLHRLLK